MDALLERVQATLLISMDGFPDAIGVHDPEPLDFRRGIALPSMPECEVPLSLTRQRLGANQEASQLGRVVYGQLGVKAFDSPFYTR